MPATSNEISKDDANTTSNKIVANQNHKVAQNSTPEGKDTEKIKNPTKDEKSDDVPKVTNEGPIDRNSWKDIKVYEQRGNNPKPEIADIPLVKNDNGNWKPINLTEVENNFVNKNKDTIDSKISEGIIKDTNDIKYWFSDENGNQLDPTKVVDVNKLPSPYILFESSLNSASDSDQESSNTEDYIRNFNKYVKEHPFIIKNGQGDLEYIVPTFDNVDWSTRTPHDVFNHLINDNKYGSLSINESTIPDGKQASSNYVKSLFTIGTIKYKIPDGIEDPVTGNTTGTQKIYVAFDPDNLVSKGQSPTISSEKWNEFKELKDYLAKFPTQPTSEQLQELSDKISNYKYGSDSEFNSNDYVSTEVGSTTKAPKGTIGTSSSSSGEYVATLIPEYDKNGNRLDKYAGRIWAANAYNPDGTQTLKLHYESLDPNYSGYLGNLYGYTGFGDYGSVGTYILPIINKTAGQATLKFYDQTTNSWLSDTDSSEGAPNESITFANGAADLNSYLDKGYEFVNITKNLSADTTQVLTNDKGNVWNNLGNYTSDENQRFVINLVHAATPTNVTKTANRTIHYVLDDGSGLPDSQKPTMNDNNGKAIEDVKQKVTWNGTEFIDKITGKTVNAKQDAKGNWVVDNSVVSTTNWTTDDDTFKEVTSPSVDGYTATPEKVNDEKAKMPDGDNNQEDIYVIYKNAPQKATLRFWDDNTNSAISGITDIDAQGNYKTDINFNGKDDKYNLAIAKGYEYVNVTDDATDNTLNGKTFNNVTYGKYDSIKDNNQTFTVHFKHAIVPVTPDKPGNGLDDKTLSKTVTETVHYVGNGAVVPSDKTFDLNFNGTAYYDSVTKNWTDAQGKELTDQKNPVQTWTPEKGTSFDIVESPTINGYHVVSVKDHTDLTKDYNDGQNNVKKLNGISQDTPSFQVDVTYMPDAPIYHLADESEHKTIKRIINYLDSETNLPISVEPAVNQEVTLTRTKIFDQNNKFIGYGTISSDGKQFTLKDWHSIKDLSDTLSEVKSADLSEYGYKHQMHFIDGSKADIVEGVKVDGNTPENITINVYYDHDTVPVEPTDPKKPTDPINSKHPEGPKYPNNVDENSLNKTITRTINYVDSDGNLVNGSPDGKNTYKQIVKFTRTAIVDKVNGKLLGYDIDNDGKVDVNANNGDYAWKSDNNIFDEVISKKPSEINYDYVNIAKVGKETVSYNSDNETVNVIYSKTPIIVYHSGNTETKNITRTIKYIDSTTEQPIPSDLAQTKTQPITFTRTQILDKDDKIVAYGVVSKDGTSYTLQDWTANTDWPEVVSPDLSEKGYTAPSIAKVDEAKPSVDTGDQTIIVKYGHQIIPVTPEKPGNGIESTSLTKPVKETIHYIYRDGSKAFGDKIQTLTFEGTGYYDAVTRDWTDKNGNKLVDQTKNISWKLQNGKDDNGSFTVVVTPIKDGYTSKVQDGYDDGNGNVAEQDNINHQTNNIDVTVTYTPNPVSHKATLNFYDDTEGKAITGVNPINAEGHDDDKIVFDGDAATISNIENEGYKLVNVTVDQNGNVISTDEYNPDFKTYNKADHHFTVHFVHTTKHVDKDHPGHGYKSTDLEKTVTTTVHYVDEAGHNLAEDVTNSEKFEGTGDYDAVTGEWVTVDQDGNITGKSDGIKWNQDKKDKDAIDAKAIKGYDYISGHGTVDQNLKVDFTHGSVPAQTMMPTTANSDITFVYKKHVDAPVAATGSVTYVDETTGKTLKNDSLNGNVGEKIAYTTQDKIDDYLNQGYKLESSDFKDGNETFQKDGNIFTVKLVHDTVPVKPGDKTKPGDPINNPNKDPNGPKYPDGVSQDSLTTTTSRHIVYRDENGHLVNGSPDGKSSYLQTAHFGRTAIVDKVTGQILGYDTNGDGKADTQDGNAAWQSLDNTFDAVASQDPSKLGYDYVDKSSVGKATVGAADKDSVVYVTYGKNTTPEPQPTAPQPTLPSSNPSSTPTTNPAPSNPTEPIEPSTPEPNIPDTPEPDIPETPKHHKKTPTPKRTNTDYAPQAENANTNTIMPIGETILSNGKIVDSDGNVIGYIDKSGQTHYALPQTGENDNEDVAALIAGGVAVSMSLLGLAGVKKRRRN